MELSNVNGEIYFLERNDLFIEEKPYAFRYEVEGNGIPQTNMTMKAFPVEIHGIRGFENCFTLENNGFEVMKLEEEIAYSDFYDTRAVRRYFDVIADMIRVRLQASAVEVFRYGVSLPHSKYRRY